MQNQIRQIREFFKLLNKNKAIISTISGMLFAGFRYMSYQVEYNKEGWKQEVIMHHADNVRCWESLGKWKSQDSIRDQQIWDKAFNSSKERILQPALDSMRNL